MRNWPMLGGGCFLVLGLGATVGCGREALHGESTEPGDSTTEPGDSKEWTRQWGTAGIDEVFDVTVDGNGNIFAGGLTLDSKGSLFSNEPFVTKLNPDGTVAWTRQLATRLMRPSTEWWGAAVATDPTGNIFAVGSTTEEARTRITDAFATKLNPDGTVAWTRQWGTSGEMDWGADVTTDSAGNVFVVGYTGVGLQGQEPGGPFTPPGHNDAVVTKLNPDGTVAWTRRWGTSSHDDLGECVVVDGAGNIFVGGSTNGSLQGGNAGDTDSFVTKLNADGQVAWIRQWGTPGFESVANLAVDGAGNIFAVGTATSDNVDTFGAFVTKLNPDGTVAWKREWGKTSTEIDYGAGVAVDRAGNILVGGAIMRNFPGVNLEAADAFVTNMSPDGTIAWTRKWGTSVLDVLNCMTMDPAGNIFAGGRTRGSLQGKNAGVDDAFVTKLSAAYTP